MATLEIDSEKMFSAEQLLTMCHQHAERLVDPGTPCPIRGFKCPHKRDDAPTPCGDLSISDWEWFLSEQEPISKTRGSVLNEAHRTINGQRIDQYGNPEDSFDIIAEFWSSYTGVPLRGKDVAMMMAILKIVREMHAPKRDNLRDACGYLALAADMVKESPDA